MKKILVALSGGVDSAGAALLLKNQGCEVAGATMLLRDGGESEAESAKEAARQLKIDFYLFDLREEFRQTVILPFMEVYRCGGTPNPCVVCNKTMKFGLFLEKALALGYEGIATGHYVKKYVENGRFGLKIGENRAKDQSYMLYSLSQDQLAHCRFPLGGMEEKAHLRELLQQAGVSLAGKQDSQDICFVPQGDYMAYLISQGLKPQRGNFVRPNGEILGPHKGMEAYTTGQRRGLGLAFGERAYVLGKQGTDVILGPPEGLFSKRVLVENVNYLPFAAPPGPLQVEAKLRYTPRMASAWLYPTENGCELLFDEPQRAVTPGQAAVFYQGDILLGGGTIVKGE